MAQRTPSTFLASHAYRRGRPGRISLQSRHSSTASSVSSQESDSSSQYGTPPSTRSASRPGTPPTKLPTPFVTYKEGRQYIPPSQRLAICNTTSHGSSSDDEAVPSGSRATAEDKGKGPGLYADSESPESIVTRLSRMEGKLDSLLPLLNEILSREKQPFHEEKPQPATEEEIQSSQTYQNLKADNEELDAKLEIAGTELAKSQHAHEQTLRELQALKELADPEVNKRKGRGIKDLEMTPDNYQYVKVGWVMALDGSDQGWDMADRYKAEKISLEKEIRELRNRETIFLKHICELRDANKDLSKRVEAHELANIVRDLMDGSSRTQPQAEPESNTGPIGPDPDTKEEKQLYGNVELNVTDIQDGEEVQQGSQHEDQHEGLEDGLEQTQEKAPQAEQEEQQRDELKDEPAILPELRGPYEGLNQDLQEEEVEKPQDGQREIDEDRQEETVSLDKKIARGEGELKELTSTTQELSTGGHTEPELPERQDMVGTTIGNDQPTVEATAEQSPPETQDVAVVDTAPEPDTTEPVDDLDSAPVTSTERKPKKDRRRSGRHKDGRREHRDHERNRGHRRDREERRDHRPNHRNDRPRDTENRIRRRQQEAPATYWIGSTSRMKTYFGTTLRELIRSLRIRIRG